MSGTRIRTRVGSRNARGMSARFVSVRSSRTAPRWGAALRAADQLLEVSAGGDDAELLMLCLLREATRLKDQELCGVMLTEYLAHYTPLEDLRRMAKEQK